VAGSVTSELCVLIGETVDLAGWEVLEETDETVESMDRFLAMFLCIGFDAGDIGGEKDPFTSDMGASTTDGEASGLKELKGEFAVFVGEKRS
jgi:hypothetical protein